jgi:putative membrane protein (TIGR04086 family)
MSDLDLSAIAKGAGIAALIAVPAGIAQNLTERGSSLAFALFLVVVLALVAGGYVAGREQPDRALTHGGLAALALYLAVQLLGIVLRVARGDAVTWVSIPLIGLLSASCGVIGGYLAFRRSRRDPARTPTDPEPGSTTLTDGANGPDTADPREAL